MASSAHFLLCLALSGSFLSLAHSLTCSSQSFSNRSFAHCDDLPQHNAFLHWTHHPNNSSLSIAYLASPPQSGGWVAWGVNPTSTGMLGSQAFLAALLDNVPTVRTYDLSSYSSILPSPKLSFSFWDVAVEHSNGRFTIFVTVQVPPKAKSLNQVWQVGPAVNADSGIPMPHELKQANLNSKGVLVFDKNDAASPAPHAHGGASPAPEPAVDGGNKTSSSPSAPSPDKSGVAGIRTGNLGLLLGWFVFVCGIISFSF